MLFWALQSLVVILLGLGGVAFITLLERKMLGLSQMRLGPNKVSILGLAQPIGDGVKLLWKTLFLMSNSQIWLFSLSPILLFIFFMISWTWIIPWAGDILTLKYGSMVFFTLLGMSTYAVIMTGWSSTSNFSKLGGLRGMLQSLSFEVALILTFLIILVLMKNFSLKLNSVLPFEWMAVWVIVWGILSLMETNRAPFDLLEGESELISGFNIEMGSSSFVFLFLSEYGMIFVMGLIACVGALSKISFFSLLFAGIILFMRSCFPRVRYDIMMSMMWLILLPLAVWLFMLTCFAF